MMVCWSLRQSSMNTHQINILEIGVSSNERWSSENYELLVFTEFFDESLD